MRYESELEYATRHSTLRRRRVLGAFLVALAVGAFFYQNQQPVVAPDQPPAVTATSQPTAAESPQLATTVLDTLSVKGRAPKTGYTRAQFGDGWLSIGGCDTRNIVLNRDLRDTVIGQNCKVMSGVLDDPYTGATIAFVRGAETSDDVQIDHVVALSNAWQTGAQLLDADLRIQLANDPLCLLYTSRCV